MPERTSFTLQHTEAMILCPKRPRDVREAEAPADTEAPTRLPTAVIPEGAIPVRAEGSDKKMEVYYAYG